VQCYPRTHFQAHHHAALSTIPCTVHVASVNCRHFPASSAPCQSPLPPARRPQSAPAQSTPAAPGTFSSHPFRHNTHNAERTNPQQVKPRHLCTCTPPAQHLRVRLLVMNQLMGIIALLWKRIVWSLKDPWYSRPVHVVLHSWPTTPTSPNSVLCNLCIAATILHPPECACCISVRQPQVCAQVHNHPLLLSCVP
jgi:hypothetical protein